MPATVRCEYGTVHPGPYALEVEADGRCSVCVRFPWMVKRPAHTPAMMIVPISDPTVAMMENVGVAFWPIVQAGKRMAMTILEAFEKLRQ